jgi:hypothetical protein
LEIAFDEGGPLVDRAEVTLAQVIKDGDLMAGVDEFFGTNAADITGSSRNENVHGKLKASVALKSRVKMKVASDNTEPQA